ncbi:MAG: hypothetical protein RDV48_02625 [Candidatus Eremiobacteraeota bacterium]|nr:hypothetical protein [Candidatus Eremiobacteraeota bacterium]
MGTHILLDRKVFEEKYLTLAREFLEERWQEILALTEDDMDAERNEYEGDKFALVKDGMRTVLKGEAVIQIYRACIAECRLMQYSSWTCDRFWQDMENGGYGSRETFWDRLREKGQRDAYISLLRTVGIGLEAESAVRHPWWLFGKGPPPGRFYGEWAALTAPREARLLVGDLNATGAIDYVIAMAREDSPDLAKHIEKDHRETMELIALAGEESHWVLGFEFGT